MAFTIIILVFLITGWFIGASARNNKKQNMDASGPDKDKFDQDLSNRQI